MKNIFKKHPKKIIFFSILLFLIALIYYNVKYNIEGTVAFVTDIFIGPRIESEKIVFLENKIVATNVKIKDYGINIVESPKVEILYSKDSLKKLRVEKIIAYGGVANIVRDESENVNIVKTFVGPTNHHYTEEELRKYIPETLVPIDRIEVRDVTLNYTDLAYTNKIERTVYNINGYLTFSKKMGIDMEFSGNIEDEKYKFLFNDEKEPFDVRIILENIPINTNLMQYSYDGDQLIYEKGIVDMDFAISPSGMRGFVDFKDVLMRFKDYDDDIKLFSGKVLFSGHDIEVSAKGNVFGEDRDLHLDYRDGELDLNLEFVNIDKEKIDKFSYFGLHDIIGKDTLIEKLKMNLNFEEKKGFKFNLDFFSKDLTIDDVDFERLKGKVLFDEKGLSFKTTDTKLNYFGIEKIVNIKMNYRNDAGNLKLVLKDGEVKNSIIPDILVDIDFKKQKENYDFELKSLFLNLKGSYSPKTSKIKVSQKKDFNFIYDIKNQVVEKMDGKLKFKTGDINHVIKLKSKDEKVIIEEIKSYDLSSKEVLTGSGNIFLDDKRLEIDYSTNEFRIKGSLNDIQANLELTSKGKLVATEDSFKNELNVIDLDMSYSGFYENIKGNLVIEKEKDKEMVADFNGEVGKINIENYVFYDFKANFGYEDSRLKIFELKNSKISLFGDINAPDGALNLSFNANDLDSKKLNLENIDILLRDISGSVKGSIKRPEVTADINDGSIHVIDQNIDIKGEFFIRDKVLNIKNLYFDKSVLNGNYYFRDKSYKLKINVVEENANRYLDINNFAARIISEISLRGSGKRVRMTVASTVDEIFYNGKEIPKLYFKGGYETEDYEKEKGIFDIYEIVFKNKKNKKIFDFSAQVNLDDISFSSRIENRTIDAEDINEYLSDEPIKGQFNLSGELIGKIGKNLEEGLEDLTYALSLESNQVDTKGVQLDELSLVVLGDQEKVFLDNFNFKYKGNQFKSSGQYSIEDKDYHLNLEAKEIDLELLNSFIKTEKVNNIKGLSSFNLFIDNQGSSGYLNVSDFRFDVKEYYLKGEKINGKINLVNNEVVLEYLSGDFNRGKFKLNGKVVIPKNHFITEREEFLSNLNYNFKLNIDKIKYNIPGILEIVLNSDLNVTKNKLIGNIEIQEGKILDIPSESKNIWMVIKKFFSKKNEKTVVSDIKEGNNFEIIEKFTRLFKINLNIDITEGIDLEIDTLNLAVEDIRGKIVGKLGVLGENSEYILLGDLEILDATLLVSDNMVYVTNAVALFNDRKTYLPDINPSINVQSYLNIDGDDAEVSLNGNLKNLRFYIMTKEGKSSGNLSSLLTNKEMDSNGNNYKNILRSAFRGQITKTILGPFSRIIRKIFNLSKFKISSNVLSDDLNLMGNDSVKAGDANLFKMGAKLEIENDIFNKNLYWNASAKFTKKSGGNVDLLDEFDMSLNYKYGNGSIGIGMGKVPDYKRADPESKRNINYHINLKFSKKYDSILEIFNCE